MTKWKNVITLSKSQIRGDEITLCLLVISLIGFSALGKAIDDFLFSFCFGWIKYGVYALCLLLIIPLCCGYRIKIKT